MKAPEFLKKHRLKEGDVVEFRAEEQLLRGTIVPPKSDSILALKLENGYNTGIELGKIKGVKKLGSGKGVGKPPAASVKRNPALPTISILHTGGTIASRVDYRSGAVYSSFNPADLLTMFPELSDIANFDSKLLRNMWSDDLRFEHIGLIAKELQKEAAKGAAGIIIGMGTDNLAVAAAGLAFALEECPLPVLLVGAQRSSDRGSSDAAMNLICAARFIAKTDFGGVAVCMHDSSSDDNCAILPPCKTRKLHTSRRDAFKAVNDTPVAKVNYKSGEIEFIKKGYPKRKQGGRLVVKPKFENRVGLLKVTINMFPEQFEFFSKNRFKGLVLEGTGLGHTPGQMPDEITKKAHKGIYPAIKKFVKQGGVAVMTSQCLFGRVQMHVYDKGTDLMGLGVIPGEDMLPETAFVKLAWLLGNYPAKKAKELVAKNLRGEISERTRLDSVAEE
jgi:glutamyl-tRNA(Gln) amidotransferase subunit D